MIRPARPEDEPAVVALLRAAGLFSAPTPRMEGFVVAEDARGLAGCAAAERHGSQALLRSVAARAETRAGGLGSALAEAALSGAAARGAREAWLLTETSEAFFAKRGFARVAREAAPPWLREHPQWTTQCPASALVMRRTPASPDHLFVYGTLRSGSEVAAARRFHAQASSRGPAWLRGRLLDLGAYPGLVEPGEEEVAGELFLLPRSVSERTALWKELDAYEGVGPVGERGLPFQREVRWAVGLDGSSSPSWVYLWRGSTRNG